MIFQDDEFVVLDTETTGLEPEAGHKIIEFGAVKIVGEVTEEELQFYIDPQREIPEEATSVHGMTRDDCISLGGGRVFKDIAQDLWNFLHGRVLVAHNANFDMSFLDHEFETVGFGHISPHVKVIDTLGYANGIFPTQKNNLDALAKRYGIDNSARELHGALLDSQILAEVFLAMRKSQKHLQMSDVIKSTDAKVRTFDLAEIVKPISKEISLALPVASLDDEDEVAHKHYLGKLDSELSW